MLFRCWLWTSAQLLSQSVNAHCGSRKHKLHWGKLNGSRSQPGKIARKACTVGTWHFTDNLPAFYERNHHVRCSRLHCAKFMETICCWARVTSRIVYLKEKTTTSWPHPWYCPFQHCTTLFCYSHSHLLFLPKVLLLAQQKSSDARIHFKCKSNLWRVLCSLKP